MRFITFVLAVSMMACSSQRNDQIDYYFKPGDAKNILAQVVRYNYYNEGIPVDKRFEAEYDAKYEKVIPSFEFYKYKIDSSGKNYFILYRLHHDNKYRATGGYLKLDSNTRINTYHEIFVTPLMAREELTGKTDFLFGQLVKQGTIEEKYLKMKSYIEWPDDNTHYDSIKHDWILRNPL
jgi:hypothetical protein